MQLEQSSVWLLRKFLSFEKNKSELEVQTFFIN